MGSLKLRVDISAYPRPAKGAFRALIALHSATQTCRRQSPVREPLHVLVGRESIDCPCNGDDGRTLHGGHAVFVAVCGSPLLRQLVLAHQFSTSSIDPTLSIHCVRVTFVD